MDASQGYRTIEHGRTPNHNRSWLRHWREPMISTEEMTLPKAFTAIIIVVALFKLIDYLTIRSRQFERFTEQEPTLLAKDGKYIEEYLERPE